MDSRSDIDTAMAGYGYAWTAMARTGYRKV